MKKTMCAAMAVLAMAADARAQLSSTETARLAESAEVARAMHNTVTLGADASVAAGPVGRRAGVGTDGALTAEIVSCSRSKGLFAGIDLSGGILRPDEDGKRSRVRRDGHPAFDSRQP